RYPDRLRIAKMNGSPVRLRVARRDDRRLDGLCGHKGPHRHHQRSEKGTRRLTGQFRPIHGNVAALFKMTQWKAGTQHGGLEAERAPEQKCDKIVPPPAHDIEGFLDQYAALINAVAR